jgi:integrase
VAKGKVKVADLDRFLLERHDLSERTKTQYRMAFQALARHAKNPFSLSKNEANIALEEMSKRLKPSSWNAYVNCIRAFYKWKNKGEYPPNIKNVKLKPLRHADYVKTKLLSEQEIKAIQRATSNPRDRAFIAVLAATGARRGEMLNLAIRDIQIRPYGYDMILTGKTGTHPSPPVVREYAKILRVWLEHHPMRDNPDAPLWTRLRSGHWGSRNQAINRVQAHNIVKNAAREAGLKRNVHMHMFRHTENTMETKRRVPAAARRKLHGWTENSTVPNLYEHLTDEDSVNAVLVGYGLKPEQEPEKETTATCGYCGEENPSMNKYCHMCGTPLTGEGTERIIQRQRTLDRIDQLLSNPKVLEALKKQATTSSSKTAKI